MLPKPMTDPCMQCEKRTLCASAETYKCPLFHQIFVQSWDETVAFLKRQLTPGKET